MKTLKILLFAVACGLASSSFAQSLKPPHEILIEKVVKALKKENSKSFATSCIPNQMNFNELCVAGYSSRPDIVKGLQSKAARDSLVKQERESFDRLIQEAKKEGLTWKSIKLKWVGIEVKSTDKKLTRLSIPFDVTTNGKDNYRIILDFCTQLTKKPDVILPGEFRWEGKQQ